MRMKPIAVPGVNGSPERRPRPLGARPARGRHVRRRSVRRCTAGFQAVTATPQRCAMLRVRAMQPLECDLSGGTCAGLPSTADVESQVRIAS